MLYAGREIRSWVEVDTADALYICTDDVYAAMPLDHRSPFIEYYSRRVTSIGTEHATVAIPYQHLVEALRTWYAAPAKAFILCMTDFFGSPSASHVKTANGSSLESAPSLSSSTRTVQCTTKQHTRVALGYTATQGLERQSGAQETSCPQRMHVDKDIVADCNDFKMGVRPGLVLSFDGVNIHSWVSRQGVFVEKKDVRRVPGLKPVRVRKRLFKKRPLFLSPLQEILHALEEDNGSTAQVLRTGMAVHLKDQGFPMPNSRRVKKMKSSPGDEASVQRMATQSTRGERGHKSYNASRGKWRADSAIRRIRRLKQKCRRLRAENEGLRGLNTPQPVEVDTGQGGTTLTPTHASMCSPLRT